MSGRITRPGRTVVAVLVAWVVVPLVLLELSLRFFGQAAIGGDTYRATSVPNLNYLIADGPNRFGFRSDEVALAVPPDRCRVIVLGDSVAYGAGVERRQTLVAVAAEVLGGGGAGATGATGATGALGYRVEFVNAAVPGYNAAEIAALYRHVVSAYGAHLVVYVLHPNDVMKSVGLFSGDEGRYGLVFPEFVLREGLVPGWVIAAMRRSRIANVLGTAWLARRLPADAYAWAGSADSIATLVETVRGMEGFAAARGEGFVVAAVVDHVALRRGVCANGWECEEQGRIVDETLARLGAAGVATLDLSRVLQRAGGDYARREMRSDRVHPNEEGHRLLGEALAGGLREAVAKRCQHAAVR